MSDIRRSRHEGFGLAMTGKDHRYQRTKGAGR